MILNRQRDVRVSLRRLEEFCRRARKALHLREEDLTICFVTDREMANWNRAYRGKNRPTDVLSFPNDAKRGRAKYMNGGGDGHGKNRRERGGDVRFRGTPGTYLGDIAIAPCVARRNARQLGRSVHDEMCILILHGMLHLMGYDHETDTGQMDRREQRLRSLLGLA
jgi:probable rRNA maturation factor